MVLGLSLSLLGLLGLAIGAKKVSDSADVLSGKYYDGMSVDEVLSNSEAFTEKYLADSVINSESAEPYITSPEIERPTLGGGNKDDKKLGKSAFLGGLGLGSFFSLVGDDGKRNRLWLVVGICTGAYVAYKVVK